MSKSRLGGGISSLLGEIDDDDLDAFTSKAKVEVLSLGQIKANPKQVRQYFKQEALEELAQSIKQNGIIQPIVVEPASEGLYTIIAGERRWRAAQMAGLREIPVVIKTIDDSERIILALLENIQREDLKPIEEAKAYQDIISLLGITHAELAEKLGKSRSAISNSIRLLDLDDTIQENIDTGLISAGHARALLTVENNEEKHEIVAEITKKNLSVRDVESLIKQNKQKFQGSPETSYTKELMDLENRLKIKLGEGLNPKIRGNNEKGSLTINYNSENELYKIITLLDKD